MLTDVATYPAIVSSRSLPCTTPPIWRSRWWQLARRHCPRFLFGTIDNRDLVAKINVTRYTKVSLPNSAVIGGLRHYCLRESFIVVCLLTVAVGFNLITLFSGFSVDVSIGTDLVLHTLLAEAVVEAITTGRNFTDPWQSSMGMGHPMFHYYQHLPHVVVGLIHLLTFQTFAVSDIVIWTTYLLLGVFPLSIYWALRRFGFDQLISAMGGLVASLIATSDNAGFGYSSYVVSGLGLYTQLWAMVLMPLSLAWGYRVITEGRGYFWAVLLLAATLMSHLLYGYMAFLTLGVLTFIVPLRFKFPWESRQPGTRAQPSRAEQSSSSETASLLMNLVGRGRRLILLLLLVVAVTSYFLVPFLLDLRFLNSSALIFPLLYDSHGHAAVLKGLVEGDLFDFNRFPSLTVLLFAGLAICVVRGRKELFLIPVVVSVLWLLLYFGRPTWGSLLNLLPMGKDILLYRFIGGVHLGGIFLIAVALGTAWRWAVSRGNGWYITAALVLTLLVLLPVHIERRSYADQDAAALEECRGLEQVEEQDVTALFYELKQLPPGRVYAGRAHWSEERWGNYYATGCTRMQSLAYTEGLDVMGSLYHTYSLVSDLLNDFDETRSEQYNLFNIRYVIAPQGQYFPDFVKPIGQFGRHVLYEVETTGYFDLVGSELAFAGTKSDFVPVASAWLASGLPEIKQHPEIYIGRPSQEIPTPLSDASAVMSNSRLSAGPDRGMVLAEEIGSGYYAANVRVERESILMLKASYHPNWRATVDGVETDTMMLMPSFVGIKLAPGEHQVRLEYRSRPLRSVLLVFGFLILALIAIGEMRGRLISDWFRHRVRERFST